MRTRTILRTVIAIFAVVIVIVFALLRPWNLSGLVSNPDPVSTYAEAIQRIEALQAQESADMNPVCKLKLLTHGQKVEDAIVLVHGYTSCPEQFYELGKLYFDLGYNVLIATLPHHGLADRMTEVHAQMTAEELAAYADQTVDIAQGLGEHVTMLGLSGGGTTTAWAAQQRADLDLAVILSPAFGYYVVPTPLTAGAMNLYLIMSNSFTGGDDPAAWATYPSYSYPRPSTHALAQILRLGFAVQAGAKRERPAAGGIILVYNASDQSVNNAYTREVEEVWLAHGANLISYTFEADLALRHDYIDPNQVDQKTEIVYPRLIELTYQSGVPLGIP